MAAAAVSRWLRFFLLLGALLLETLLSSPLRPSEIVGTWSGVLLPVKEDESIDWIRLELQVDALLNSGIDGIYTSGTAEEMWTLDDIEFSRLGEIVARKAKAANKPFQIGASNPSPQVMRRRVLEALSWNPSAIQIILPDYYTVTASEALTFVADLARLADPTGLVLYNPGNAKRILEPAEYGPLAPHVVGLKVVDKDRSWYSAMRACCSNLSIAVTGHHLASGHLYGANASYSNVAALSPSGAARWYHDLIKPGENDTAKLAASLELEDRIGDFFAEFVVPFASEGFSDMALDKLLAEIGGWSDTGTKLRWPYASIPIARAHSLRDVARKRLPELFVDEEIPLVLL
eukprot:TRINITY_DN69759_c0_g1_i1.p1 TRINITY_DN69759_c0_g1~~TRINITY_DN69759_c0_g1_i1.p1  ORF type:complete len:370 (-),score=69.79 TRINITY_DN69759_c0_g1_i1:98-1138(-)